MNAKYLSDSELKVRYGWSMSSRMPATYVHLSAADLDDKLLSIFGGKPVEKKPEFAPVICLRCREQNSPGTRFCGRCGAPLNKEESVKPVLEIQQIKDEMLELKNLLRASLRAEADRVPRGSSRPLNEGS